MMSWNYEDDQHMEAYGVGPDEAHPRDNALGDAGSALEDVVKEEVTEEPPKSNRKRGRSPERNCPMNLDSSKRIRKRTSDCPVPWCTQDFKYPKAHVFNFHFPTKLDMECQGRHAARDRAEALEYLARSLTGKKTAKTCDLMDYITTHRLSEPHSGKKIDQWLYEEAKWMEDIAGMVCPRTLTIFPLNYPMLVFHWAIMLELVSLLEPREYNLFMRLFSDPARSTEIGQRLVAPETAENVGRPSVHMSSRERRDIRGTDYAQPKEKSVVEKPRLPSSSKDRSGICGTDYAQGRCQPEFVNNQKALPKRQIESHTEPFFTLQVQAKAGAQGGRNVHMLPGTEFQSCEVKGGAFDSHFHIDRLRKMLGVWTWSLHDMEKCVIKRSLGLQVELKGAVTNFCDPDQYPSEELIKHLHDQGIVCTIGLHPKTAASASPAIMESFRRHLSLPGVVGLGEVGLDQTVPKEEWPMQRDVLADCLGMLEKRHVLVLYCRASEPETQSDLMASLFYQCSGVVPADQKIHLHCFEGTTSDLRRWMRHFPNLHVGFTQQVACFSPAQQQMVRMVRPERLLLETNAPYFAPRGMPCSTPHCVGAAAVAVARILGEEVGGVMARTWENGRRLYFQ